MSNEDYEDLDDIISELEDSLGVDASDYLEEDDDFDSFDLDEGENLYGMNAFDDAGGEDEDFEDDSLQAVFEESYNWRDKL